MPELSELEGTVLGLVKSRGPCTAYRVRKLIQNSPSSHWRASAGSIYPLMTRLEEAGLIAATSDPSDGRSRRDLEITPDGRKALKDWLKAGAEDEMIEMVFDPVRTRLFYFDALSKSERMILAKKMLTKLEGHLAKAEARHEEMSVEGHPFALLGSTGAVLACKARVEFMRNVVATLESLA